MKSRKSKSFWCLDTHNCRIWIIDSYFYNWSRWKNMDFIFIKILHNLIFFFSCHATMDESYRKRWENTRKYIAHIRRIWDIECFWFFDEWRYPIYLSSLFYFFFDNSIYLYSLILPDDFCMYFFSPCWILVEYWDILISVYRECERPWNRCRWHIETMRNIPMWKILFECFSLFDSKSMLFINNDESKMKKANRILYECMCTKNHIRLTRCESRTGIFFHTRSNWPNEKIRTNSPLHEPCLLSREMLSGKYLCRSHDSNLYTCRIFRHFSRDEDSMCSCEECYHGFSCTDISLEHTRHSMWLLHIFEYLEEDDFLFICQGKRQRLYEFFHDFRINRNSRSQSLWFSLEAVFFFESAFLKVKKLFISYFPFCSLKILERMRKMNCMDIFFSRSHSLFHEYCSWNSIWNFRNKITKEDNLFSNPRTWNIVEIRIYRHEFSASGFRMLYFTRWKRESPIFIFWKSIDQNLISSRKLLKEKFSIEPNCLSVRTISITQNCLDKKFLIARSLTRKKFDFTFDNLFFCNI